MLYTESHVAAKVIVVVLLEHYYWRIREWSQERKMIIEEVKVQSSNEVLI
jgi:hypothetical protein